MITEQAGSACQYGGTRKRLTFVSNTSAVGLSAVMKGRCNCEGEKAVHPSARRTSDNGRYRASAGVVPFQESEEYKRRIKIAEGPITFTVVITTARC